MTSQPEPSPLETVARLAAEAAVRALTNAPTPAPATPAGWDELTAKVAKLAAAVAAPPAPAPPAGWDELTAKVAKLAAAVAAAPAPAPAPCTCPESLAKQRRLIDDLRLAHAETKRKLALLEEKF